MPTTPSKKKSGKAGFASAKFIYRGHDRCIGSTFLVFSIGTEDFLTLTQEAYEQQGMLDGQRDVVHTASAKRIRTRMAQDLAKGAALPPIVLGTTGARRERATTKWTDASLRELLTKIAPQNVSIIDGMQRTTVIRESAQELASQHVRVELWLAPSTDKLIYRMLILNTGQIPWTIRRQLEVVYRSFIEELKSADVKGLEVYKADDSHRRTDPGEFQAHDLIEMYLAFNLRKPHVDKESALADQFSRLDLIESVSKPDGMQSFLSALKLLVSLDKQFARASAASLSAPKSAIIPTGRHVFDKGSACAGFMAAYAQFVRGRLGMDRDDVSQTSYASRAKSAVDGVVKKLKVQDEDKVTEFLAIDTLREVLDKRSGGQLSIGEREREVFTSAFRLLFEEGAALPNLEPCWRAQ